MEKNIKFNTNFSSNKTVHGLCDNKYLNKWWLEDF